MMRDHYILDGHKVVQCDMMTWARWYEDAGAQRVVAKTKVGDAEVSTVFLGLDHRVGDGAPEIFETMIFGGVHDQGCWRYSTWEEAEKGHARAVEMLSEKQEHNA